jgi:hypothetical protein
MVYNGTWSEFNSSEQNRVRIHAVGFRESEFTE